MVIKSKIKTEEIWEKFCCRLKSFIKKRITDPSAAEDIFQDVFLKIHARIDTLKDETKIRSWVYQIAQNTIIDYYRKHKTGFIDIDSIKMIEQQDEEINPAGINSFGKLVQVIDTNEMGAEQDVASGLRELVASLPEKYKEAIVLVEFEGLSQTKLAEKLGISVSGAKSRVQRGRQLIKDALMRCCHFEFDKYGTIIDSHPVNCCCCN